MRVWSALFNIIALILILFIVIIFFNTTRVLERDFDQARLDYAVSFATRAMFEKTLEIGDLNADYTDISNVQLNSSNALDTFDNIMCMNYDLSTSKENKTMIENSIASVVLASSDGYYIAQLVNDYEIVGKNGVDNEVVNIQTLKWSPKIPYYVTLEGYNTTYALNFIDKKYISIRHGVSNADSSTISIPQNPGYPGAIDANTVLKEVNNQITNSMIYEMNVRNYTKKENEYKFYLPLEQTYKGVNPIEGPSILMLVQGVEYASTQRLDAISVAGYKVAAKIAVIAFEDTARGNRKFYCYESQLPSDDISIGSSGSGRYRIVNYYNNTTEAAKAGYAPNYEFLKRKIIK